VLKKKKKKTQGQLCIFISRFNEDREPYRNVIEAGCGGAHLQSHYLGVEAGGVTV
jgi:hypothetical protein